MSLLRRLLRAFGPAVTRPNPKEIVRAALGAGIGLLAAGFLARALHAPGTSAFLIAPLGATAFLLFVVPNSPLAQPWSAIIGNSLSAVIGITVIRLFPAGPEAIALAVMLAVLCMMLARAMHPPGGAVALLVALNPDAVLKAGYVYAASPVLLDTTVLVFLAIAWNRLTGRHYPFRQPPEQSPHGTRDQVAERRLGLPPADLARILREMNLAENIGPEDLARVIGVAEAEATARHLGGLTCGDVMSHDIVAVGPRAHIDDLAALFREHRFKTLPVIGPDGDFMGLVSQSDVIGLTDDRTEAEQLMTPHLVTVTPITPIARLLTILADGGQQSVPVVDQGRLVGLLSRTDMINAMAHALRG